MRLTFIILTLHFLSACDSGTHWENGSYSVYWIDTSANRQLGYNIGGGSYIGRVEGEVIGVGVNTKYVVAKRINHQIKKEEYFYIEKSKDHKFKNGYDISIGPLDERLFLVKQKELGLPQINTEFK